jgi:hypothetical protein
MILKLRKLDRNGSAIYAIEGVRGSVYVTKGMLAGDPPAELEVAYDGFTAPGASRAVPKNVSPEQIEKARLAAEKAAERAAKAQERAAKAAARAAKFTEQPAEPVTA